MARMTNSGGREGRDDLGARLLAAHPRGEQWRQIDVTVANLTFDQLERMGALAEPDAAARDAARAEHIDGIVDAELAGRLGSRWVRWMATFGLPQPAAHDRPAGAALRYPYTLTDRVELPSSYVAGVLTVFDAGLATATSADGVDTASYELLITPWRRVCLPSRFTPTSAYGPHTQPALAVLSRARSLRPDAIAKILRARADADPTRWSDARHEVNDSAANWGFPFRAECLFWEAVPAAEDAARESPTNPWLAESLWAAATTQAFAGRLGEQTSTQLDAPWRAAGLALPI